MKAGITTTKSRSVSCAARSGGRFFCAVLRKKARSRALECLTRKSRSGSLAASVTAIRPAVLPVGLFTPRARSAMSMPTGSITYTVSTSAMPFSTTLGGTCCRPSALRSRLSTTMILVNEVTITPTKGASATTMTVISAEDGVNWVRSMGGSGLGNARAAGGYPAGRR